jgi:hypothetical protein
VEFKGTLFSMYPSIADFICTGIIYHTECRKVKSYSTNRPVYFESITAIQCFVRLYRYESIIIILYNIFMPLYRKIGGIFFGLSICLSAKTLTFKVISDGAFLSL